VFSERQELVLHILHKKLLVSKVTYFIIDINEYFYLSNVGMPQKQKKAKIRASKQQVAKHE
jgi:hypothetical protein